MTIWMTGVSNDYTREAGRGDLYGQLGVLLGPATFGSMGAKADYTPHLSDYCSWGLDNGCYTNMGSFDQNSWLDRLEWIYNNVPDAHERCSFAVAPDVFDPVKQCGDPIATIDRSRPVLPLIRERGAPAALVFQDGLEKLDYRYIPWDEFDVAFIGGGDRFKLGHPHDWKAGNRELVYDRECQMTRDFMRLIFRCHEEGKAVHFGRVNTQIRLIYSHLMEAESCDGTLIAFAGQKGLRRIEKWMRKLNVAA